MAEKNGVRVEIEDGFHHPTRTKFVKAIISEDGETQREVYFPEGTQPWEVADAFLANGAAQMDIERETGSPFATREKELSLRATIDSGRHLDKKKRP